MDKFEQLAELRSTREYERERITRSMDEITSLESDIHLLELELTQKRDKLFSKRAELDRQSSSLTDVEESILHLKAKMME